jgi:hypothetical protein
VDIDQLKEILSDICEEIERVDGNSTRLGQRLSVLEELVKQDAELKIKYEAAQRNMVRGNVGGFGIKTGLKVRIKSLI